MGDGDEGEREEERRERERESKRIEQTLHSIKVVLCNWHNLITKTRAQGTQGMNYAYE